MPYTVELVPDDFLKVFEMLLEAQTLSYELGLKFKLPLNIVDHIHAVYSNPRDRLLQIIIQFLNQVGIIPTWRVIIDALRSPAVNLPHLAKRVEHTYFSDPTSVVDESDGKYYICHYAAMDNKSAIKCKTD